MCKNVRIFSGKLTFHFFQNQNKLKIWTNFDQFWIIIISNSYLKNLIKSLTKYKRPKMKRDARQKCSLFLIIFSRSYFVRALVFVSFNPKVTFHAPCWFFVNWCYEITIFLDDSNSWFENSRGLAWSGDMLTSLF